LYQVTASLLQDCESSKELDSVSTRHGFRSLRFDAKQGFFLNQNHYKVRGFCDHNVFGVVGMAVPDRINLFRVRTYTPLLLEILKLSIGKNNKYVD
jgi:beta-galactosidase/beta-glucuronidase